MDPITTIGDSAAFGAFLGAFAAAIIERGEAIERWMTWGVVLGGAGGVGRVLAGA